MFNYKIFQRLKYKIGQPVKNRQLSKNKSRDIVKQTVISNSSTYYSPKVCNICNKQVCKKYWRHNVHWKTYWAIFNFWCSILSIRHLNLFISFLYLGFLSRKFMIHMTAGGGEGYFSKSSFSLHPLYRHLDISRMINAESSPLHITSSRTRTKLRDH